MIVGIGANVYDTLITLSGFPKEDTKMRADGVKVESLAIIDSMENGTVVFRD